MITEFPRGKTPVLASADPDGDRFYTWKGERFYSATTIIGAGVVKFALPNWYAKVTAELAYRELLGYGRYARPGAIARRLAKRGRAQVLEQQARGLLKTVKVDELTDEELALRYLKAEAERIRDAAGVIGSDVHSRAEDLVLEHAREAARLSLEGKRIRAWPDEIAGWQAAFVNWLTDFRPEFLATEFTVFNPAQGYAGTGDAIVRIEIAPGVFVVVLIDYKAGNQVHAEVCQQLAAYRNAEFIGLPDGVTEVRDLLPLIERAAVLHLRPPTPRRPRGYVLRWVRSEPEDFASFLNSREGLRWHKERVKGAIGDVIEPLAAAA